MYNTRCSCQISIKLDFPRQTFGKYLNVKFNENPYSWSRVVPCGQTLRQTDRQDEVNNRFSQFCKRTQKDRRETKQETKKGNERKKMVEKEAERDKQEGEGKKENKGRQEIKDMIKGNKREWK